jgi:hypothetical protein
MKTATIRKAILILLFLSSICVGKLIAQVTGLSFTMGYSPSQTLESESATVKNGQTVHADFQVYNGFDIEYNYDFGIIGGAGLRSYKTDGFRTLSSDPYKKRTTRFDLHIGPSLWVGAEDNVFGLLLHPQIGWGFGGYYDNAPKSYFACMLNADITIGNWITIGVTYRPLYHTITSSIVDPYSPASIFHLVHPALEFRIGIFHWLI